jgi:hypothetical protein
VGHQLYILVHVLQQPWLTIRRCDHRPAKSVMLSNSQRQTTNKESNTFAVPLTPSLLREYPHLSTPFVRLRGHRLIQVV